MEESYEERQIGISISTDKANTPISDSLFLLCCVAVYQVMSNLSRITKTQMNLPSLWYRGQVVENPLYICLVQLICRQKEEKVHEDPWPYHKAGIKYGDSSLLHQYG